MSECESKANNIYLVIYYRSLIKVVILPGEFLWCHININLDIKILLYYYITVIRKDYLAYRMGRENLQFLIECNSLSMVLLEKINSLSFIYANYKLGTGNDPLHWELTTNSIASINRKCFRLTWFNSWFLNLLGSTPKTGYLGRSANGGGGHCVHQHGDFKEMKLVELYEPI